MQQQQWINSGLPGVWTEQQQRQQQGVSSAHHHRTAQKQAVTTPGGHGISGARRRGTDGWVLLWSWVLLGSLLLPGAWSFLSEEQEELIVELHNLYRSMVSPTASAMLPLRWDPSLKVIAEGYAAKCVWNHNPELEETGENLFANTGPMDLREALEKWFFENLHYDYNNNSCPEDKMCGHYTQMVWADTHRVGCAWHLCNTMDGLDFERANFLVCNYYPAGNFEDERPYVEGEWCSSCPENLQKCENNLCVADSVEDEEEEEEEDDDEGDAVIDEGDVTPPPATPPPATPESSPEASPNTPPPHPAAPGTMPPSGPTSPYPPAPEGEEQELTEKELDQIASNKKGERAGESDKKREMETNREKEMTRIRVMSSDAASSLRSTVFQLVLVFLTVGLIVRE